MKVAAIGRTEILYDSIQEISGKGHEVALIITCEEASHYKKSAADFKALATGLGAAFICTERINTAEVISNIRDIKPGIAVSMNWKTIIGQEIIDCFDFGIINAHAGDLPRYRGNAVPNWAIINGETEVVLSLHYMTTELDAGPILLQKRLPINPDTRIGAIYEYMRDNYPRMFAEVLNGLEIGTIISREQPADPALALRCFPRLPRDNEIDWAQPAVQIDRLVRAVSEPFDGAYTYMNGEKLIVWRAHTAASPSPFIGVPGQVAQRYPKTGEVSVITGDGLLVVEEVETGSRGRLKAAQAVASSRVRLGMHISEEISVLKKQLAEVENRLGLLERFSKRKG